MKEEHAMDLSKMDFAQVANGYLEAIAILREIMSIKIPEWQSNDDRIDYIDLQVDKDILMDVEKILEKAPKDKQYEKS